MHGTWRCLISKRLRVLACIALVVAMVPLRRATAQSDAPQRKVRSRVAPTYPDIARRMSISGVVRMQVVVEPNGTLKDAKVMGGHPLLVNAAMDAVKKWKFEPGPSETTENVEFTFAPQ
ncbi:MAG: energy transducer TonB [Terriglobales bacterium]|jgi:TonB family protein